MKKNYVSLNEVYKQLEGKHTREEIVSYLKMNEEWGYQDKNEWFISAETYTFLLEYDSSFFKMVEIGGFSKVDLSTLQIKGDILDIGAGGEGTIARKFPDQVIGINPEWDKQELIDSHKCKLKIFMDARDLKFLDNTFATVTSFFTIMYIDFEDYLKVFQEVYRVLQKDGTFYIWDIVIPKKEIEKEIYMHFLNIDLNGDTINTGFGTPWKDREQNSITFNDLATQAGFIIEESVESKGVITLKLKK